PRARLGTRGCFVRVARLEMAPLLHRPLVPAPPGAEDAVLDVRAPGHRVTGVVLDVGAGADEVADRGVDPLLADLAPLDAVGLAVARLAGHRAVLARGGDRGRPVLGADGDRRVLVLVAVRYLRRLLPGDPA